MAKIAGPDTLCCLTGIILSGHVVMAFPFTLLSVVACMKTLSRLLLLAVLAALSWLAWVVFIPADLPQSPYKLTIGPNRTLRQVAHALADEGVIHNRNVMVLLGRAQGMDRKIKAGLYQFNSAASMWEIVQRLADGHPDEASLTVIEGWNFHQLRQAVERSPDLKHDGAGLSDEQLLQQLGLNGIPAEGLFFPSTYLFTPGSSDMDLYRRAYNIMQQKLEAAWTARKAGLPYHTPYELLIMASLVEKETSLDADRPLVAAVFVNRLNSGMRLQTDPSVIYGMGTGYHGNISKADLRRDTPYNTYTRNGLTPTPIALPGEAALQAAANPANAKVLYFVAKGDGSSYFSETLEQHNQAVRKYILKKDSNG